MSNQDNVEKEPTLKPLSEKELDEIFAPAAGSERETTSVGRSYGWSDQPSPKQPGT